MAQKDIRTKQLLAYNNIFADIVNVLIFDGEEIIKPEDLEETETVSQYEAEKEGHEQYRDIAKLWKKGGVRLAFFGIENQSKPDRDMALRVLAYDGMAYRAQLNHKEMVERYPVVTLVLYFGEETWNAPKSLLECLGEIPEKLKPFVNDYNLNVVQVADLPLETVKKFQSDFRAVAEYFRQRKNLKDYQPEDRELEHIEEVLNLIAAFGGETVLLKQYEEKRRMNRRISKMSEVMKGIVARSEARGRSTVAQGMLRDKLPFEMVSKYTGLSEQELRKMQAEMQ